MPWCKRSKQFIKSKNIQGCPLAQLVFFLAAAAQGSSATCGPLHHVIPPFLIPFPVISLNCPINKAMKGKTIINK